MHTYYDILNITSQASYQEVNQAFSNAFNKFNKKNLSDEEVKNLTIIKRAYSVLGDYHNRRKYDDYLDSLTSKKSLNVRKANIDGIIRPFLRDFELDNKISNSFYEAEKKFNDLRKQSFSKKEENAQKTSYYYQRQSSMGKQNSDGNFEIQTRNYVNNNGTETNSENKYFYDGQGRLLENTK